MPKKNTTATPRTVWGNVMGEKARAAKVSREQTKQITKTAAKKRWGKK